MCHIPLRAHVNRAKKTQNGQKSDYFPFKLQFQIKKLARAAEKSLEYRSTHNKFEKKKSFEIWLTAYYCIRYALQVIH